MIPMGSIKKIVHQRKTISLCCIPSIGFEATLYISRRKTNEADNKP
jgi:hypothetical protein